MPTTTGTRGLCCGRAPVEATRLFHLMPQLPTAPPKKPAAVQVSGSAHSLQKAPLPCPDRTRPELQPSTGGREIWVETQNRNKNVSKQRATPHLLPQSPSSEVPDGGWKQSKQSSGSLQPEASWNNLLRSRSSAWSSPQPRESGGATRGHGSAERLLGAGTRQRERRASPRGVSARLLSRVRRLWVFFEGSSYTDRSQISGCAAVGGCTASPSQAS